MGCEQKSIHHANVKLSDQMAALKRSVQHVHFWMLARAYIFMIEWYFFITFSLLYTFLLAQSNIITMCCVSSSLLTPHTRFGKVLAHKTIQYFGLFVVVFFYYYYYIHSRSLTIKLFVIFLCMRGRERERANGDKKKRKKRTVQKGTTEYLFVWIICCVQQHFYYYCYFIESTRLNTHPRLYACLLACLLGSYICCVCMWMCTFQFTF